MSQSCSLRIQTAAFMFFFICESLGCMQRIIRFTVEYENVMVLNLFFSLSLVVERFCSMGRIGEIFILIVVTLATASSIQASCSKPLTFVATEGKNEACFVINRVPLVHAPADVTRTWQLFLMTPYQ